MSAGGITPGGLARLRKRMVGAGHVRRLKLAALKPERAPVLAGGFAIMAAALAELDVERINPVGGALRLGVLYDLLGRTVSATSAPRPSSGSLDRYRVDREHARAGRGARQRALPRAGAIPTRTPLQELEWAALLHEIGISVSHIGFHKHGAYILQNADMPGFSSREQQAMALLVLCCRGGLAKMVPALADAPLRAQMRGAAPRGAVPPRAAADRPPRIAFGGDGGMRRRRAGALAEGPSADRAPDRGERGEWDGGRLSLAAGARPRPTRSGPITARSMTTSPARSRFLSHQTAPFFTAQ